MRSLVSAEERFYRDHGRFATLDELLQSSCVKAPGDGYSFVISVEHDNFRLNATGVIRESWIGQANENLVAAE